MTSKSLPVSGSVTFDELKKTNEHGAKYRSARELQPLLEYGQSRRFEDAINRAMISCGQSGNAPENPFAGAGQRAQPAKDQQQAIRTHEAVGREVRETIKRIGGAMPENIPPAEHNCQVEKRIKSTPPFLELDGSDAKGLIGTDGE